MGISILWISKEKESIFSLADAVFQNTSQQKIL